MAGHLQGQTIKISGIRSVIAKRMVESLAQSAQLTYFADADITDMLAQRAKWKDAGQSIGIEDCIIYALARSLRAHPQFNAVVDGALLTHSRAIDISVAISSPAGLMTPVIRSVEELSLSQIAAQRRDLVSRALAGQLEVSDMKGGTFTISNLGLTRVRQFTPILNRPQLALLGLGRIEAVARPDTDGNIQWRNMIGLSLTADHRILDGEPSGQFLTTLCQELEEFDGLA